ncbi:MAG: hypothetical protein BWY10_02573 [Chloroflexi bacterium ADurb.Bin180]|nr:MAG: hypothetical protein BWY10_02573 [Chloroflexi bacterium ADurb.Bin180]
MAAERLLSGVLSVVVVMVAVLVRSQSGLTAAEPTVAVKTMVPLSSAASSGAYQPRVWPLTVGPLQAGGAESRPPKAVPAGRVSVIQTSTGPAGPLLA